MTNDLVAWRLVDNPSPWGCKEFKVCILVPRQVKNFRFIGGDNGQSKTKKQFIVLFSMQCFDKVCIRFAFFYSVLYMAMTNRIY